MNPVDEECVGNFELYVSGLNGAARRPGELRWSLAGMLVREPDLATVAQDRASRKHLGSGPSCRAI